jgi:hypothetical protein
LLRIANGLMSANNGFSQASSGGMDDEKVCRIEPSLQRVRQTQQMAKAGMNFVAINFETANYQPEGTCALRLVKVVGGVIVNKFAGRYRTLGFQGASSHSGRRTFITNAPRRNSTVGGNFHDVKLFARHSALGTTQRYIEADGMTLRRVVNVA